MKIGIMPKLNVHFVKRIQDFYHVGFSVSWCSSKPFPSWDQFFNVFWGVMGSDGMLRYTFYCPKLCHCWFNNRIAQPFLQCRPFFALPPPQVFKMNPVEEKYSVVDLFAGKAAISRAFAAKHLNCATLDIAIDPRDELWPHISHKCNPVIPKIVFFFRAVRYIS